MILEKMISQLVYDIEHEFKEAYKLGQCAVSVAHTQNDLEAVKFKEEIERHIPNLTVHFVDPLSLSVSCHIGPGALACAITKTNRKLK